MDTEATEATEATDWSGCHQGYDASKRRERNGTARTILW